jgi:hypothetical protein
VTTPTYIPDFTSAEGKAEVMRAYQAVMDQWRIPYKDLTITNIFGETHVIASGPDGVTQAVKLIERSVQGDFHE